MGKPSWFETDITCQLIFRCVWCRDVEKQKCYCAAAKDRERRRIRRAIAPALRELASAAAGSKCWSAAGQCKPPCRVCRYEAAVKVIDRATRALKKGRRK